MRRRKPGPLWAGGLDPDGLGLGCPVLESRASPVVGRAFPMEVWFWNLSQQHPGAPCSEAASSPLPLPLLWLQPVLSIQPQTLRLSSGTLRLSLSLASHPSFLPH